MRYIAVSVVTDTYTYTQNDYTINLAHVPRAKDRVQVISKV